MPPDPRHEVAVKRPARQFPSPLPAVLCGAALAICGCSQRSDERPAAVLPDVAPPGVALPAPGADVAAAPPAGPACRVVHAPAPVSPVAAHAAAPALGWGPGVLGLSYVHDEGDRALVALKRFLDGAPHGPAAELGEGAARAPTALAWNGSSFVLGWNEPSELVGEVFLGMVDAAGAVSWSASRVTSTLRTGAWRMPGRTAVESKDPRLLALGDALVVSWRTHTQPEAFPLYFAAVRGLEVSAPAAVSAEQAFVFDHQPVAWGGRPALAYFGRFEEARREVRVARLTLDPPGVARDVRVAAADEAPDLFELAAVPLAADLGVLWRGRTEWNSTANVRFARVAPDAVEGDVGAAGLLSGVLVANPQVHVPRRTFAAAPADDGFVAAWAYRDPPAAGGGAGLRLAPFRADGTAAGAPLAIDTGEQLARDPVLLRSGVGREYWFAFVRGEPPAQPGRVWLGAVVCDPAPAAPPP